MIINGGVITGNGNPHAIGGAIYNCGDLEMIDGEISNNTAESGGGINNNSVGEVLLTGGEIKNNTATDNGGGIMTVDGTVTLDGASITGNTSQAGYGGGISVENSGDNGSQVVFEMKRGTISDNTASNDTGSEVSDGATMAPT